MGRAGRLRQQVEIGQHVAGQQQKPGDVAQRSGKAQQVGAQEADLPAAAP